MQQLFLKQDFPEGPDVAIHFISDERGELKVQLVQSKNFSASFFINIDQPLCQSFLSWLKAYGRKEPPPLNFLPRQYFPSFQKTVLNTLITIPFGKTITYGNLATLSGHVGAARAVGTVCRKNNLPLFIPCHRVISSNGALGGFAFGSTIKKTLLEFEQSI